MDLVTMGLLAPPSAGAALNAPSTLFTPLHPCVHITGALVLVLGIWVCHNSHWLRGQVVTMTSLILLCVWQSPTDDIHLCYLLIALFSFQALCNWTTVPVVTQCTTAMWAFMNECSTAVLRNRVVPDVCDCPVITHFNTTVLTCNWFRRIGIKTIWLASLFPPPFYSTDHFNLSQTSSFIKSGWLHLLLLD